jgi:signal transduction histidine kinase
VAGLRPWVARTARWLAAAAGVAVGIAALGLLQRRVPPVGYAATSTVGASVTGAAGFALIAAGLVVATAGRAARLGDTAILAGICWFCPIWVGWQDGPPLARSIAMPLASLVFPLLVHLLVGFPAGVMRTAGQRFFVLTVYAETGLVAATMAAFRDPYLDPRCWANCTVNEFLVRPAPALVRTVDSADRVFVAAVALIVGVTCLARLAVGTRPARRQLIPVLLPGAALALATLAKIVRLQQTTVEDPFDAPLLTIFTVQAVALVLLAVGLVWIAYRPRLARRRLARIVANLEKSPDPGALAYALGGALRDPRLRIHYWLPTRQRYVDPTGRPSPEPASGSGLSLTRLQRDGHLLAVVSHGVSAEELEQQLGPATLLGLENERLRAEILGHLEELRASRTRIVEAADRERRQLERDLHDGAQQHLLALSYELRVARGFAEAHGEGEAEIHLARAIGNTQTALAELRELAQGIYPAVLEQSGLLPAVTALADTAPMVVEIQQPDGPRLPAQVEAAGYFAVREALNLATARQATHATVAFAADDGQLQITIRDNGPSDPANRTAELRAAADRVNALGGTLRVDPTACVVVIPCE